ncbi:hypothetical protein [Anditalea andensis]|uniref:Uncharacterized protein n=1 Tax=Anditalea andensis TaxID=1048983 RepID=A0A074KZA2_9BACT|nr:hypothetical protein [Anditalea andensis]KEO72953.1 hypothetical protein EL17_15150 [Anditalea andensis]
MIVINYHYGNYSRFICGGNYHETKLEDNFHGILQRKIKTAPLSTIKDFFDDKYSLCLAKDQLERLVLNVFSKTPEWKEGEKDQMEHFVRDFIALMEAVYLLSELKTDSFGSVKKLSKNNLVSKNLLADNAALDALWDFLPCTLDHTEALTPLATIRSIKELFDMESLKNALYDWKNEAMLSSARMPQKILNSMFFVHNIFHCLLEASHLIFVRELDSSEGY